MTTMRSDDNHPMAGKAWWRFPMVWMVWGGPAVVVVASFVTLWLVLRTPDPVVDEDYYQKGLALSVHRSDRNLLPAETGRNHAATPTNAMPPDDN